MEAVEVVRRGPTLLPRTTKGKLSGSLGLAWIRNSSLQLGWAGEEGEGEGDG